MGISSGITRKSGFDISSDWNDGPGQGGGGGSGPPTEGLVFQLDGELTDSMRSDDAGTLACTEGQGVAVWVDQSGLGNDWYQTNASYRPSAQVANKRVFVNGTGTFSTSFHLIGPNISGWTEGTFAARLYVAGALQGATWGTTAWNSTGSVNHWNNGGNKFINFGVDTRPADAGQDPSGAWITLEENVTSAGVVTRYVNGSITYGPTDLGNTTFRATPYLGCGVRSNGPEYSLQVYFARVVGYNKILTADERTAVNAWLEAGTY